MATLSPTSQRSTRPAAICAGVTTSRPAEFVVEPCIIGRAPAAAARGNVQPGGLAKLVKNWKTGGRFAVLATHWAAVIPPRSEEHTPELQSRQYTVCRLLVEKKNTH